MARRSDIPWAEVQVDYSLGLLSIREIARKHGIADSNLRSKAKQEGWSRGNGEAARVATREALVAAANERACQLGAEIGAQQAQSYRERLEEEVLSAIEVVREHQLTARRGMQVAMKLLKELESACGSSPIVQAEIERCRQDDAARAALIERQLGVKARVETFDRWASALSRVTAVEREAHQIGAEQKGKEIDDVLLRIHRERDKEAQAH